MLYTMIIYYGSAPTPDDPDAWGALSPEEQQAVYRGYGELNQTPGMQSGPPMAPAAQATTVQVGEGQVRTADGPFVAPGQAVGGFFTIEADDLDAAVAIAAKVPHAGLGGAVEIRPQRTGGY